MNELDLLKTHWQKDQDLIKFKKEDIIRMIHKNSSSIVKWIFIICCLELLLGLGLSLFPAFYFDITPKISIKLITNWILAIIFYTILLYFIYKFFKLFKNIKSSNSTKSLLESIITVRKNTDNYIKFNLLYLNISAFVAFIFFLFEKSSNEKLWVKTIFIGVFLILFTLFLRKIINLYYKIIYGILLKKLNKNYKALIELE